VSVTTTSSALAECPARLARTWPRLLLSCGIMPSSWVPPRFTLALSSGTRSPTMSSETLLEWLWNATVLKTDSSATKHDHERTQKDPARKKEKRNLTMTNEKNGYSNDAETDLLHPCSLFCLGLFHFFDHLLLLSYSSLLTAISVIGWAGHFYLSCSGAAPPTCALFEIICSRIHHHLLEFEQTRFLMNIIYSGVFHDFFADLASEQALLLVFWFGDWFWIGFSLCFLFFSLC
jgi:hypothetical protein